MLAGLDDEGTILGQDAFAVRDGMLDQRRSAEIPVKLGGRVDALIRQIERRHPV